MLANPFKTRVIAEAQIKTDKVDARILADLLRGNLVPSVHIVGRESRQIKEVLRQRFRASAHDVTQSHSSRSARRSARSEVAAMQRPLRAQGSELSGEAGASRAGRTPVGPAVGALEGIGRTYP